MTITYTSNNSELNQAIKDYNDFISSPSCKKALRSKKTEEIGNTLSKIGHKLGHIRDSCSGLADGSLMRLYNAEIHDYIHIWCKRLLYNAEAHDGNLDERPIKETDDAYCYWLKSVLNLRQHPRNGNWVILRIWQPGKLKNQNVGHVSLQLSVNNRYVSLYPEDRGIGAIFGTNTFFKGLEADLKHGLPDGGLYVLFTLDVTTMEGKCQELLQNTKNYALTPGINGHENCCSIVIKILESGGMNVSGGDKGTLDYFVHNPDEIKKIVFSYHQEERLEYRKEIYELEDGDLLHPKIIGGYEKQLYSGYGRNPCVAMNDNGFLIVMYQAILSSDFFYCVGQMEGNEVTWGSSEKSAFSKGGLNQIIVLNNHNHVICFFENEDGFYSCLGKLDEQKKSVAWLLLQPQCVWLFNYCFHPDSDRSSFYVTRQLQREKKQTSSRLVNEKNLTRSLSVSLNNKGEIIAVFHKVIEYIFDDEVTNKNRRRQDRLMYITGKISDNGQFIEWIHKPTEYGLGFFPSASINDRSLIVEAHCKHREEDKPVFSDRREIRCHIGQFSMNTERCLFFPNYPILDYEYFSAIRSKDGNEVFQCCHGGYLSEFYDRNRLFPVVVSLDNMNNLWLLQSPLMSQYDHLNFIVVEPIFKILNKILKMSSFGKKYFFSLSEDLFLIVLVPILIISKTLTILPIKKENSFDLKIGLFFSIFAWMLFIMLFPLPKFQLGIIAVIVFILLSILSYQDALLSTFIGNPMFADRSDNEFTMELTHGKIIHTINNQKIPTKIVLDTRSSQIKLCDADGCFPASIAVNNQGFIVEAHSAKNRLNMSCNFWKFDQSECDLEIVPERPMQIPIFS